MSETITKASVRDNAAEIAKAQENAANAAVLLYAFDPATDSTDAIVQAALQSLARSGMKSAKVKAKDATASTIADYAFNFTDDDIDALADRLREVSSARAALSTKHQSTLSAKVTGTEPMSPSACFADFIVDIVRAESGAAQSGQAAARRRAGHLANSKKAE